MFHRHPVGVRAHGEIGRVDDATLRRAKELLDLAFDLWLLVSNQRNDVAQDVQRRDAWIARAGYRLHRHRNRARNTKTLMDGSEREGRDDRSAVAVGDDPA